MRAFAFKLMLRGFGLYRLPRVMMSVLAFRLLSIPLLVTFGRDMPWTAQSGLQMFRPVLNSNQPVETPNEVETV